MLQKLSFGQKVFGGAGIVFLISTFLAWFTISLKGGLSTFRVSGSASGFLITSYPATALCSFLFFF